MMILNDLSDDALTIRLVEIRKQERGLLVEFLCYLAELDRRKTVLALGFPSLFSFCTDHLGFPKASAFRRTTAARLLARFPLVAEYLADGRLNLTTLVELRDVLDEAHLIEILDRAAGRNEDQVKELVAALRPQPAPADLLRKLPDRRNDCGGSGAELAAAGAAHRAPAPAPPPPAALPPPAAPPLPPRSALRPATTPAASLQPIAPERHVLRVTVGAAFAADLEAVRHALSHKLPAGSLEDVLHECIRVTLQNIERRRAGAGTKQTAESPPPGSRYVPAAVRNEVWRRDGGQCAFVGSTGRRCTSRHQLELHHLLPFAMGGPPTAANLALRCRVHNRHAAEQDYGREHIARKVAASRFRDDLAAPATLPGLSARTRRAIGSRVQTTGSRPGWPSDGGSRNPLR
jgi:5-methylcytosine-specific restriction endonuclease McrA